MSTVIGLAALCALEIGFSFPSHIPQVIPAPAPGDYSQPPPQLPCWLAIGPCTYQQYLDSAPDVGHSISPGGIDARFAWSVPGGKGSHVQLADVEISVNASHVDLPSFSFVAGYESPACASRAEANHGTNVLGILGSRHNGVGTSGIVPDAAFFVVSPEDQSCAPRARDAIRAANTTLRPGDVILIEVAIDTVGTIGVPAEGDAETAAAIADAVAAGRVVVEGAGNGGTDHQGDELKQCASASDTSCLTLADSGAIIVGAGHNLAPTSLSNFGARVDLQGYGASVVTTGAERGLNPFSGDAILIGDLYPNLPLIDYDEWKDVMYTGAFNGTSSAAAIVAGASVAVEGAWKAAKGDPSAFIAPRCLRRILAMEGTPQAAGSTHIGPLPNLATAIPAALTDQDGDGIPALCDCDDSAASVGYPPWSGTDDVSIPRDGDLGCSPPGAEGCCAQGMSCYTTIVQADCETLGGVFFPPPCCNDVDQCAACPGASCCPTTTTTTTITTASTSTTTTLLAGVSVIDTASLGVIADVSVGSGSSSDGPTLGGIAIHPDGSRVYVATLGAVTVLDTSTNGVEREIPITGLSPGSNSGITINPAGTRLYVATGGADLAVIDTTTDALLGGIPLGLQSSEGVGVNPDGTRVYVTNQYCPTGKLLVVDTVAGALVGSVPLGDCSSAAAYGVVIHPDGSRAYAGKLQRTVAVIDTATLIVAAGIGVGVAPLGLAITPDGTRLYATSISSSAISVIDTSTNRVTATIPVSGPTYAVAVNSADTVAYATNARAAAVSATGTRLYIGHSATRATVFVIDTATYAVNAITVP